MSNVTNRALLKELRDLSGKVGVLGREEVEARLLRAFQRVGNPESKLTLHYDGRVEYQEDWDMDATSYENALEALEDFDG